MARSQPKSIYEAVKSGSTIWPVPTQFNQTKSGQIVASSLYLSGHTQATRSVSRIDDFQRTASWLIQFRRNELRLRWICRD
jgi:hypothetical protein